MSQPAQPLEVEQSSPNSAVTTRWWIVGLLMALCFISHMNRVSMSIAADERIMAQYQITTVQMGQVYSAFLLVYTIFMIPGGMFIDRVGVRAALALMALMTAAFGALTGAGAFVAAGQILLWLIVIRSVMGLFTTPLHPGCARAVGFWIPESRQAFVNGLVTGAALLGVACTAPLFGALIDWADWPAAFLITGSCTAVLGFAWLKVTGSPRRSTAIASAVAPPTTVSGEVLTSPNLLLLTLSYAAIGYFQYIFFYWMHYYFGEVLALGKQESRWYSALPVLAMALAMPLGGWLSDRAQRRYGWRVGRAWIAAAAMIAASILLDFGITATGTLPRVFLLTAALGTLGLSEAVFWRTAVELGGTRGATAAAVMNTGGNGIGLLAPVVTPWIALHLGWQAAIGVGAFVCLLGALCWLWIRPPPATNEQYAL